MPKQATKATKQLAAEIDGDLRDQITQRAKGEGRTIRGLLERMARFYFANAPTDSLDAPAVPATDAEPKAKRKVKGK